jgi:hypothetical protein
MLQVAMAGARRVYVDMTQRLSINGMQILVEARIYTGTPHEVRQQLDRYLAAEVMPRIQREIREEVEEMYYRFMNTQMVTRSGRALQQL